MTASKHAEVIALAAERLRHASLATHQVLVRLEQVAQWLELAAQVRAGTIPCDWCQRGECAPLEAACALLGDPSPQLLARHDRRYHRR